MQEVSFLKDKLQMVGIVQWAGLTVYCRTDSTMNYIIFMLFLAEIYLLFPLTLLDVEKLFDAPATDYLQVNVI